MRRGPQPGAARAADANACRAREAWGPGRPDWVETLAQACDAHGQSVIARRLGYSASVVSQVLGRSYRGDLCAVETAVRGALMTDRVACPELGDLALGQCLEHQDAVARGVRGSELRIRLARTCPACPHNRKRRESHAVD